MNNKIKFKKIFSFLSTAVLLFIANISSAIDYVPLEPLPGIDPSGGPVSLAQYITILFNVGMILVVVSAVFMIVIGGFQYMGSEAVGQKGAGKKKITNAIYGLLLALVSYLGLQTINPQILNVSDINLIPVRSDAPPIPITTPADTGTSGRPSNAPYPYRLEITPSGGGPVTIEEREGMGVRTNYATEEECRAAISQAIGSGGRVLSASCSTQ